MWKGEVLAVLVALLLTALWVVAEHYGFGVPLTWWHLCWIFVIAMSGVGLVRMVTQGMNSWK